MEDIDLHELWGNQPKLLGEDADEYIKMNTHGSAMCKSLLFLGHIGIKIISWERGLGRTPRFLFLTSSFVQVLWGHTPQDTQQTLPALFLFQLWGIAFPNRMQERDQPAPGRSMGLALQSEYETFNMKLLFFFSQKCLTFFNCSPQKQSDPNSYL